ncbi:MAG: hypothetical protein M3Z28_00465, partial [Candidatus Dormibacteraeota bacterium]|nr:hypothetical protein [Candidatus Dormibacteraeota bacterium]
MDYSRRDGILSSASVQQSRTILHTYPKSLLPVEYRKSSLGHVWQTKSYLDYGRDIMRRAYGISKIPWLGAALWLSGMARG